MTLWSDNLAAMAKLVMTPIGILVDDSSIPTQEDLTDGVVLGGAVDLTSLAATTAALKITATSDTPVAVLDPAPAGFLKIIVGGLARYVPFYA